MRAVRSILSNPWEAGAALRLFFSVPSNVCGEVEAASVPFSLSRFTLVHVATGVHSTRFSCKGI